MEPKRETQPKLRQRRPSFATDPEGGARLVTAGRECDAEARDVTWDAVIVLAMAEDLPHVG